ncbi:MAG: hypothetical protein R8G66_28685 [Cytophagales bacterium]|nr:hypothetical protein [Cytophagales bacterium]
MRNLFFALLLSPFTAFGQLSYQIHDFELAEGHRTHVEESLDLLIKTIQSKTFKEKVLAGNYTEAYVYMGRKRKNFTNQEILDYILHAAEKSGARKFSKVNQPKVMDFRLYPASDCEQPTIAFANSENGRIMICDRFNLDANVKYGYHAETARVLFHEYMHLLGFNHLKKAKHKTAIHQIPYFFVEAIR